MEFFVDYMWVIGVSESECGSWGLIGVGTFNEGVDRIIIARGRGMLDMRADGQRGSSKFSSFGSLNGKENLVV